MSKILITGANGFIGKHLSNALHNTYHEVFKADLISGDIAEKKTWINLPKAEIVIQLAGKSFVPDSWNEPNSFISSNLLGTIEALNYCKRNNARMIFLSSYLYGIPKSQPISETATIHATNPYALSKKWSEEACYFYSDHFGIDVTILRPFNVYGPGQSDFFLIPSIIHQVDKCKEIKVNDLEPKRDYIYISDLVDAIIKTLEPLEGVNIFNVGFGKSFSVKEVIDIIQSIKRSNLKVISNNERRTNEIMNTVADISYIYKKIGWQPKIDLKHGLELICNSAKNP